MGDRRRPADRPASRRGVRPRSSRAIRRARRPVDAPTDGVVSGVLSRLGYRRVSARWRRSIRAAAVAVLAMTAAILVLPRSLGLSEAHSPSLDRFLGTIAAPESWSEGTVDAIDWLGRRPRMASPRSEPSRGPATILASAPWSST